MLFIEMNYFHLLFVISLLLPELLKANERYLLQNDYEGIDKRHIMDVAYYADGPAAPSENTKNGSLSDQARLYSRNLTTNVRCGRLLRQKVNGVDAKIFRPKHSMVINVRTVIMSVNEVSDTNGIVSLTVRIEFSWQDVRLQLDANDNCVNTSLTIKTDEVWFPYFEIQNGAENIVYPDSWEKYPSEVSSNGLVNWAVSLRLELACKFDVTFFPFDQQDCSIFVQSPAYHFDELKFAVENKARAIVRFRCTSAHALWLLTAQSVDFPAAIPEPGVRFWFRLNRRPYYYAWTIVIPSIATSLQTGSAFILPAIGDEKISTAASGLISYFVMFALYTSSTPRSSEGTPMLMMFFAYNIFLSSLAVVGACFVLRLVNREMESKLEWLRLNSAQSFRRENKGRQAVRRQIFSTASSSSSSSSGIVSSHSSKTKLHKISENNTKHFEKIAVISFISRRSFVGSSSSQSSSSAFSTQSSTSSGGKRTSSSSVFGVMNNWRQNSQQIIVQKVQAVNASSFVNTALCIAFFVLTLVGFMTFGIYVSYGRIISQQTNTFTPIQEFSDDGY